MDKDVQSYQYVKFEEGSASGLGAHNTPEYCCVGQSSSHEHILVERE